jgi:hypothetical protein
MTRPKLRDILQPGDLLVEKAENCKWFILTIGIRDASVLCFDGRDNSYKRMVIGLMGEIHDTEELWRDGEIIVHTAY